MPRFPADFLDRVRAARLPALVRRGSRSSGAVPGAIGDGSEFEEHRAYQHGDDLRRVDWQATARHRRPVVRRHRRDEERRFLVLVDLSASMDWGQVPKVDRALRLGAALCAAAAFGGARAELWPVGGTRPASGLVLARPEEAPAWLAKLEGLRPGGGARELERDLKAQAASSFRAGSDDPWYVSDFYELGAWIALSERGLHHGVHPRWLQVLDREELRPDESGALELVDAETAEARTLLLDAATLGHYRAEFDRFRVRVEEFSRRHDLLLACTEEAEDELEFLRQRVGPRLGGTRSSP